MRWARRCTQPARPLVAIVAGSKVSTKLTMLDSLADKVDQLIVGGGIANTFMPPSACRSASRWSSSTCSTPRKDHRQDGRARRLGADPDRRGRAPTNSPPTRTPRSRRAPTSPPTT